jgi:hypothetical protein
VYVAQKAVTEGDWLNLRRQLSGWQSSPAEDVDVGADDDICDCELEVLLEVLEELTALEVELVLELEDEGFDCCVDELSVEGEPTVLLLVDNSIEVEVEMVVEELVKDEACQVLPMLDVLEVRAEEVEALLVLVDEEEEEDWLDVI